MTGKKLLALVMTATFATQAFAATFVIQNNDGVDEGFNDPLPPTNPNQKGNNPGTTLGEMRLNVFQAAAEVWGDILNSDITITVGGSFEEKFCSPNSATLGSAGANGSGANFAGLEPNIAYPIALVESLNDSNVNGTLVEINASFNSLLDSDPTCLGGGGFYYGLDDNAPPGTSPLYPVVLHEMAHGLGFASMTDVGSGGSGDFTGAGGFPDTFSRRLLDLDNGKSWDEMNNAERLASALNEPELVWEGAQATADLDEHLGFAPELIINAPVGIAGTFEAVLGEEPDAIIPPGGVTAGVIDGDTFGDSCTQINEPSFSGKIILFDKSENCGAIFPAFFSEFQGAVGVIIAATTTTGLPDVSGLIGNQDINIPYIGVEKTVADNLRANLATANVTIDTSNTRFNGENDGKVKMYAPAIFETGSSVSHWSTTASPNLLMEPVLGDLDFADVDLTAAAFRDIGWSVNIPGEQLDEIFSDGFEQ
ncbi:MAG: hypothetical protein QNK19_15160 [Xanthomonadales bacterium]|nr:hypothetical protein [Xanthomonadales bacterium]